MATSTPQEIIANICPGKETDPRVDDLLDLATAFVAEVTFGTKYNYALALVVCHQFQLEGQGGGTSTTSGNGAVGGVTSIKEGQLQKQFGGPPGNISENKIYWSQTASGLNLMALWDACIFMPTNRMV